MRDDVRERFFTPFLLPVTIIGGILLIGISVSRVLLAVSEVGAAIIAMLVAGYILAMAFFVEARRRIPPRTLSVGLALAFIGVLAAGAVASAAGIREIGEQAAEGEQAGGGGESGGEAGAANEPLFVAIDIEWEQAPETLPPGDIDFALENRGAIQHTVVIEELGDEKILDAAGGESDEATVTLESGEYTYYCDVPGHRATMEGTLTVEEGAEASGDAGATEAGTEATSGPTADADAS
jgi:plastocyanin